MAVTYEVDNRSVYLQTRQDELVRRNVKLFTDLWHCKDIPPEPSGSVYCPLSEPETPGVRLTPEKVDQRLVEVFQGFDSTEPIRERVQMGVEQVLLEEGYNVRIDEKTGMKLLPLADKPHAPAPPVPYKPKIFY